VVRPASLRDEIAHELEQARATFPPSPAAAR